MKRFNLSAFIITPKDEFNGLAKTYEVKSKSGNVVISVSMNTMLYQIISLCAEEKVSEEVLDIIVNMAYQSLMIVPDKQFLEGYAELMKELFDRVKKPTTDQTEEEILEEVKLKHELFSDQEKIGQLIDEMTEEARQRSSAVTGTA